jgi:hypothetical protein
LLLINSRTCTVNFLLQPPSLLSPQIVGSAIPQRMCIKVFAIEISSLSINFSIWFGIVNEKVKRKVFLYGVKSKTQLFI